MGARAPGGEEPSSSLRLALLVIGFLAVATMFVVVLYKAFQPKPPPSAPGDEDQAASVLDYPPIVAVERYDTAAPTLLDGGTPEAVIDGLRQGGVLFVFADPTRPQGLGTAHVAIDLHRRLRTRDVRVVLVVPKEVVAGNSTEPDRVRRALQEAGVVTDLSVLLDPGSRLRRSTFGLVDESAAVLWEGGAETWRVLPPSPGGSLQLSYMSGAVSRLRNLQKYAEKPLPAESTRPPEPPTRFRPGEEERDTGGEIPPPK